MTDGKVGAFFVGGEQVGGFFDWRLTVNLTSNIVDGFQKHRVASWSVVAGSYWFESKADEVEVRFYSDVSPHYWKGETRLGLYRFRPDVLVKEPIEFWGNGVLEVADG